MGTLDPVANGEMGDIGEIGEREMGDWDDLEDPAVGNACAASCSAYIELILEVAKGANFLAKRFLLVGFGDGKMGDSGGSWGVNDCGLGRREAVRWGRITGEGDFALDSGGTGESRPTCTIVLISSILRLECKDDENKIDHLLCHDP